MCFVVTAIQGDPNAARYSHVGLNDRWYPVYTGTRMPRQAIEEFLIVVFEKADLIFYKSIQEGYPPWALSLY